MIIIINTETHMSKHSILKTAAPNTPGPHSPNLYRNSLIHILIILALGIIVYSNTFNAPFILDDNGNIVVNPIIRNLGYFANPSGAMQFTGYAEYPALIKRYVGHLSFALNYHLHGLDVTGYHITNLVIHVINGVLVYLLVILTFRTPRMQGSALGGMANLIGLFSALLFVCHPVQTQAVTYIVQRLASMAAMFYLGSVVLYIGFRITEQKSARRAMYALSIISAVLAMKTKEVAFTLPLAIAMYEFMFFGGQWKKRLIRLVPILLTIVIIPLTMMTFVSADTSAPEAIGELDDLIKSPTQELSRLEYLATEMRVIVTYARLLFLPVNQNLIYDYPLSHSFWEPWVIVSFLFIVLVLGLAVYLLLRSRSGAGRLAARLAAFGVFWFFLALSVESSLIPLQAIFEHRLYLPSVGAFISLSTGAMALYVIMGSRATRAAFASLSVLLVLALSAAALDRNGVWGTEIALWEDVVRKSPGNARSHHSLGLAYAGQNRFDNAIREYSIALGLRPDNAKTHNNLGNAYAEKGMFDRAIWEYRTAIRLNPSYADAHNNLGVVYEMLGQYDKAVLEYQAALNINPAIAEVHDNLSSIYENMQKYKESLGAAETVLDADPDNADAHYNLGVHHYMNRQYEEAEEEFRAAVSIDPGHADARYNLAIIHLERGEFPEAEKQLREALGINPSFADAHNNLGLIYLNSGRYDDAVKEFQSALDIDGNYADAYFNLQRTYELMEKEKPQ
jgi:tetratricopeptide (TPR) repeat protein